MRAARVYETKRIDRIGSRRRADRRAEGLADQYEPGYRWWFAARRKRDDGETQAEEGRWGKADCEYLGSHSGSKLRACDTPERRVCTGLSVRRMHTRMIFFLLTLCIGVPQKSLKNTFFNGVWGLRSRLSFIADISSKTKPQPRLLV